VFEWVDVEEVGRVNATAMEGEMECKTVKTGAILSGVVLVMMLWAPDTRSQEEPFPQKPLKVIVAFSAGGGSDREARMLQPFLEKRLGVPVVIDNRPGGGTQIANTILQRAPADGYTVLYTNWDALVLSTIVSKPEYRLDEFEPLAVHLIDPTIILVAKSSPYNTLNDFAQAAKENPGKLAFGATAGDTQQLLVLAIRDRLKLDVRVVGYPGGGPSRAAMLGGHVDAAMAEVTSGYYLRDQAKAIAIFSDRVYSEWPEAKPINEQLKTHGANIANVSRYGLYMVRADLRVKYPGRFSKLQSALLEAGKDSEYRAAAMKAGVGSTLVWQPADRFREELGELQRFFETTKYLWPK
jgi:tripartite-type tricarboxylate transporter receptor subunit TctC